jgi:F-type H+-transporting ATPase subunit b
MGKETSVRAWWMTAGLWSAVWLLPASAIAAEGLNLAPRPWLVLTNLAIVLLLIWPVNRLLIAPLLKILQEREARTQGSSVEANATRAEAQAERERLEARRDRIRRDAAERRSAILARGKADEQRVLDAARSEAADSISAVRSSIAGELEQARAGLRSEANALAQLAAERILGRPL